MPKFAMFMISLLFSSVILFALIYFGYPPPIK